MKFICAQHVPFEPPGNLARWALDHGHELHVLPMYDRYEIPAQSDVDGLFILGGPMSVNDDHPWLRAEKELIRTSIQKHKPVLGVCLGAQLIADVLGGSVRPMGYKEIGIFPVCLASDAATQSRCFRNLPESFTALHWHGEQFQIPAGARLLASSQACPHQAFEYGSALGLQFHLEMAPDYLADMMEHCSEELTTGGDFIQPIEHMKAEFARLGTYPYRLLEQVLENWLET